MTFNICYEISPVLEFLSATIKFNVIRAKLVIILSLIFIIIEVENFRELNFRYRKR